MPWCKSFLAAFTLSSIMGCCSFQYDKSKYAVLEQQFEGTKKVELNTNNFFEKVPQMSYLEVLASVTSPELVKKYVTEYILYSSDKKKYEKDDYWASFREIHASKADDCDGGAIAAAALLNENKYHVYLLKVQEAKEDGSAHMVCVYKSNKDLFGCLSINKSECVLQEKDLTTILSLFAKEYDEYKILDVHAYRSALRFGKGDLRFLKKLMREGDYVPLPKAKKTSR